MSYISANRFLSTEEMKKNAKFIFNYLRPRGWTINAIAGMLGNMQTESTINSGIWQNLDSGNTSLGYGLVQWTPATKYLDWCDDNGLEPSAMESALKRIEYELENGLQYYPTDNYPETFKQFKTSTKSAYYLGMAFLLNYERPADQNQTKRGTQAEEWYEYLLTLDDTGGSEGGSEGGNTGGSEGGSEGSDNPVRKHKLSLLLMYAATKGRS